MKKHFNYIGLFIISAAISACSGKKEQKEEHETLPDNVVEMNHEQYKMAGIELGGVSIKNLGNILKVSGSIIAPPKNLATVSFCMGGYVKDVQLFPGAKVAKGQVLAVIENNDLIDLQQQYLESKNQLEYTEQDYERQKNLFKENVSSAKSYQQALADYKTLKSKINALEQKLQLAGIDPGSVKEGRILRSVNILSPISGYIKTVNINTGKYVSPTDALFEIVNNSDLMVELNIFEKDLASVSAGQEITLTVPSNPSPQYHAVVYQVGKAVDNNKTIKVYARVEGNAEDLVNGMFVNAEISASGREVEALPDDAVVTFEDKSYIFIMKGNRKEEDKEVTDFVMVEVQKGISAGGYTEVILPCKINNKNSGIVVKGAYNLLAAKKNAGEMSC